MKTPTRDDVHIAFRPGGPHQLPDDDNGDLRFALVHPQWGGYCFPCAVQFPKPYPPYKGLSCFDVHEFHDGEFASDELEFTRHYCRALQVVQFGVSVLELQLAAGYETVEHDIEEIKNLAERLYNTLGRSRGVTERSHQAAKES